jgi:hypothetical protein
LQAGGLLARCLPKLEVLCFDIVFCSTSRHLRVLQERLGNRVPASVQFCLPARSRSAADRRGTISSRAHAARFHFRDDSQLAHTNAVSDGASAGSISARSPCRCGWSCAELVRRCVHTVYARWPAEPVGYSQDLIDCKTHFRSKVSLCKEPLDSYLLLVQNLRGPELCH